MEYHYFAVLTPNEDGVGYTIEVPNVPGCVTSGKDFDDALDMIEDALAGCLCVMEDKGVPIPDGAMHLSPYAGQGKSIAFVCVDTDEYRRANDARMEGR